MSGLRGPLAIQAASWASRCQRANSASAGGKAARKLVSRPGLSYLILNNIICLRREPEGRRRSKQRPPPQADPRLRPWRRGKKPGLSPFTARDFVRFFR